MIGVDTLFVRTKLQLYLKVVHMFYELNYFEVIDMFTFFANSFHCSYNENYLL